MKTPAISLLFSAFLFGQGQAPVDVTPRAATVQSPAQPGTSTAPTPPPVAPDTVVVEVNGRKYTAAEVDKLIAMLPAQYQQAAHSRPDVLTQVFLMQRLSADGEKAGLDQRSPFKEQLELSRMQVLSTAELSDRNNSMQITDEEQQKYYKDNADKFKQVKVRVIYIGFNPTPAKAPTDGKPTRTEAEAKAKVEDLTKQIKAGADFGKLARDLSDDKSSAAKDGDFGVIRQDSAYPQVVKTAVFALKQGDLSEPIKEGNGYYLIRAEEIGARSFNESVVQIIQEMKKAKFDQWLSGMRAQYGVKVEDPAYFAPRTPAQLQQVH